jgi:D-aminoacyl-tRNA deacylase
MRALVQRVSRATVRLTKSEEPVSSIGPGLLVLLGVSREDGPEQAERLAAKVRALRVFADAEGNMNEPLGEREILCVSQFTLYGDARRGNRPSFVAAAPGPDAEPLYELFCRLAGAERGVFGAHMEVELVNDGPVTLLLEA